MEGTGRWWHPVPRGRCVLVPAHAVLQLLGSPVQPGHRRQQPGNAVIIAHEALGVPCHVFVIIVILVLVLVLILLLILQLLLARRGLWGLWGAGVSVRPSPAGTRGRRGDTRWDGDEVWPPAEWPQHLPSPSWLPPARRALRHQRLSRCRGRCSRHVPAASPALPWACPRPCSCRDFLPLPQRPRRNVLRLTVALPCTRAGAAAVSGGLPPKTLPPCSAPQHPHTPHAPGLPRTRLGGGARLCALERPSEFGGAARTWGVQGCA